MRIVTLVENTPGAEGCLFEHGLSIYMETGKHRMLVDTGATAAFWQNAEHLGIDLKKVDTVILSHGHYDHAGGILAFAEGNPTARIYMQRAAVRDYYSIHEGVEKYIGMDKRISELPQVEQVDGNLRIDDELMLFAGITGRRLWPKGNSALKRKEGTELVQDIFDHEQCLMVTWEGKKILLSGCAHNGILNIVDRCRELCGEEPDIVISGFHMLQKEYSESDKKEIQSTAAELVKYKTIFYSGHCTGQVAFDLMKEIMGEKLQAIHSGEEIWISANCYNK